jgi:hypothetical protein
VKQIPIRRLSRGAFLQDLRHGGIGLDGQENIDKGDIKYLYSTKHH